mgnify:CR=1 FL=1
MISAADGLHRFPRVLLGWLALPVIAGAALFTWTLLETCENSRLRELVSPDLQWKLVIFERRCSGTVAWSTHVSVVPEPELLPNAPGNLLISFERHGSLIGSTIQNPEVQARWSGTEAIELSYSLSPPVQFAASAFGRFRITQTRSP